VARVLVAGKEARSVRDDFAEWEIELPAGIESFSAHAVDPAGNEEPRPHDCRQVSGLKFEVQSAKNHSQPHAG
jgi:hypothetical protein